MRAGGEGPRGGVLPTVTMGAWLRSTPEDDTRRRYVVRHHAYGPERHERRHQLVVAIESRVRAFLDARSMQVQVRQLVLKVVEPHGHYGGLGPKAGTSASPNERTATAACCGTRRLPSRLERPWPSVDVSFLTSD